MMCSTTMNSIACISTLTCFVGLLVNASAMGQGTATIEEGARAKGVVLLRATIPSVPCPRYTTLRVSADHRQDEEKASTVTIYGTFVQSGIMDNEACSLLVPAFAGPTDYHEIGFAFSQPGVYQVSWQFGSTGVSPVDFSVDQTVHIDPPAVPDLTFLARLADPDLTRAMFGEDFFDRQSDAIREKMLAPEGAERRALKVIAQLLLATRADEPGDVVGPRGSIENGLKWAEALFALAKELPESSYAPYAAYYAGCCYVTALGQENKDKHKEIVSPAGRESAYYRKARDAFSLAVARADAYLKPRALYHEGFLHLCGAEFEQAEKSLEEALQVGGEQGTIQKIVDRLRHDMRVTREKRAARERRAD